MLNLLRALLNDAPRPDLARPRQDPAALSVCALLLEAAGADDEFTDTERGLIRETVCRMFNLEEGAVEDLFRHADELRRQSADLWRFTHTLNEHLSNDEKIGLMEDLWRVFYSDGLLSGHEDYLAHKMRTLLNLTHPQFIKAKMNVLRALREGNG